MSDTSQSPGDDNPVDEIIAEFLEATDRGDAPDPYEYFARYPQMARELSDFFRGFSQLNRIVPSGDPRNASKPPLAGTGDPDTPTFRFHRGSDEDSIQGESHRLNVRYMGDYALLDEIARGGMGVVFRARQLSLNRIVALKMILAGAFASDEEVRRFYLEAEAAAQLDHPGIVPIYEVGQYEGHHYFSMGFVDGSSLARRLVDGPLPPLDAAQIARQVAEAVQYAHSKGVIHRDLKPGNILIDSRGVPRVTDFGLAKRLESSSDLTGTGQILGTPSYMPPEQAAGQMSAVGPLSDVYSLGAILFCTLTGRPPFQAANPLDTLLQVQRQEPVSLRSLNEKIPNDLETIALKCLDKSPARRYQSAQELADDLQRYLEQRPILARPVGRVERAWRWALRNRAIASLLVLVAVSLISGTVVSSYYAARATAHANDLAEETLRANEHARRETENADEAKRNERLAVLNAQREREQRELADQREKDLRRGMYASHMNLAQAAWENGQVGRVLQLLAKHGPGTPSDEFRSVEWHYWNRLCHTDRLTLDVPNGMCNVAYSPDGKRIASAGIWDGISAIKVWEVASGREITSLCGQKGVRFVLFHPNDDAIVSTGYDKRTILWDLTTGQPKLEFKSNRFIGGCLAFSSDGRQLVAGGTDVSVYSGVAKIWDSATGVETRSFKCHPGEVSSIAISHDQKWIATVGTLDHLAKVWDATTGAEQMTLKRSVGGTATGGIAFSPKGDVLAVGYGQGVTFWEASSGKELRSTSARTPYVTSVAFSADGQQAASSSYDQTVRIWNVADGAEIKKFVGHTESVTNVAFCPDGSTFASSSMDGTVKIWSRNDVTGVTKPDVFGIQRSVAFSPDGTLLAAASHDHSVNIVDTISRHVVRKLYGHSGFVRAVTWNRMGNRIATGADDNSVIVWDAVSGSRVDTFKGHSKRVNGIAFSPDNQYVVSGGDDHNVILWNLTTREHRILKGHAKQVNSVAFNPDGQMLVSASNDQLAKVWNVTSGEVMLDLKGHSGDVECVDFSPDGQQIITGGSDKTARLWDTATGALVMTITGHTKALRSVTFSRDGRRVATASADQTVKFFDAIGGHETLAIKDRSAESIAFSRDGGFVALGGAAGPMSGSLFDVRPLDSDGRLAQRAGLLLEVLLPSAMSLDALVAAVESDVQSSEEIRKNAIRLSAEFWRRHVVGPAQRRVREHVENGFLLEEVIAKINEDTTLTPPMRNVAVAHVQLIEGDAAALTLACWRTLRRKDATAEEYQRALRQATLARRLDPNRDNVEAAIGVAQFRCGNYETSVQTLKNNISARASKSPWDLAFLAMALHHAGHAETARATLQQAEDILKKPPFDRIRSPELEGIWKEAQELIP